MKKLISILMVLLFTIQLVNAQKTTADSIKYLSVPGPANQDTTRYATIYVVRPNNVLGNDIWVGLYFDDSRQVLIVNNDLKYAIKYAKTGNVEIWSQNKKKSPVMLNVEAGKKYYIEMDMLPGIEWGYPTLTLLGEKQGEEALRKISHELLDVYDLANLRTADKLSTINFAWPSSAKMGFQQMKFKAPISTRHFIHGHEVGYLFYYYNDAVSQTFSETIRVKSDVKNDINSQEEFEKYMRKQIDKLTKGDLEKFETVQLVKQDTLVSGADYSSTFYYVTENTRSAVVVNGQHQVLEMREYNTWMYKKDLKKNKGTIYTVFFSERGLPQELHAREEIRFKLRQLISSCSFVE